MTTAALLVGVASVLLAGHAGADPPALGLAVSPARVALVAPGSRRIVLRNSGAERVVVDVVPRAVDKGALPRAWLRVVPAHVTLLPGRSVNVTLRATAPGRAEPGDHHVLVLLTTRPASGNRVAVRMRVGVRASVRVPGRVVQRVAVGPPHVKRTRGLRVLELVLVNRGNVTLQLRGCIAASLLRDGRVVARLQPRTPAVLLPRTRAVLVVRYRGRVRGAVTALLRVRLSPGRRVLERRFRLRL